MFCFFFNSLLFKRQNSFSPKETFTEPNTQHRTQRSRSGRQGVHSLSHRPCSSPCPSLGLGLEILGNWGLTTLQTFSLGCEPPFCNAQGLRATLTPSAPTGPAGVQPGRPSLPSVPAWPSLAPRPSWALPRGAGAAWEGGALPGSAVGRPGAAGAAGAAALAAAGDVSAAPLG